MKNVYFDTCVYHQPGIDLLFEVIERKNILFGSECSARCAASTPRPVTTLTTRNALSTTWGSPVTNSPRSTRETHAGLSPIDLTLKSRD